jgi:hypothetical protein
MAREPKGSKGEELPEPDYNDGDKDAPEHRTPEGIPVSLSEHPGAFTRLLIERFFQRAGMFDVKAVREIGVSPGDLVRYRMEIQDAFFAVLSEAPAASSPRLRGGVVAYLGELGFEGARDVLSGLATSPSEQPEIRAVSLQALNHLRGALSTEVLEAALADPAAIVRQRAVDMIAESGRPADVSLLYRMARDPDSEVQRRAVLALQAAGEYITRDRLRDEAEPPTGLIEEGDLVRSVGRVNGLPAFDDQAETKSREYPEGGGRDLVGENLANGLAPGLLQPVGAYEVLDPPNRDMVRLRLSGSRVPASGIPGARFFRVSPTEAITDIPLSDMPPAGHPLPGCGCDDPAGAPTWVPGAPGSPALLAIEAGGPVVLAGQPFDLRVRFRPPADQRVELIKVEVRLPLASWSEAILEVSEEESQRGEKVIPGYLSAIPGRLEVLVSIYSSRGGAASGEARLLALPTNPHSLHVVPQSTGANGKGPAHWNSSEKRYYCYARFEVVNGHSYSITVGPTVTCRVTDGGTEKANFSFTIGASTVPAFSSRILSIYTYYPKGNKVADIFDKFGDVRQTFTLQTSQGNITDWHVWQAMAQVKLSLIFVGNMSVSDRIAFQSVAETEASAVYEQQGMHIADTKRYLLPSSHSDWSRFRDIKVSSGKDGNCSSISSSEADDLRSGWSSEPSDRLDIFVVESFSGPSCAASLYGFSPVDGPTSKSGKNSGIVLKFSAYNLGTSNGRAGMGVAIAHETGHFLSLKHTDASGNFMNSSTSGPSTNITWDQYKGMRTHGYVRRHVP